MLMDLLNKASNVAMLSFVISSMLAMGAGLRSPRSSSHSQCPAGVLALLANFILMPLGALPSKVLRLDEPFGIGLLVLGCAAGAPFLPKLAELAKGNLPFAVGTMVLLMVITVVLFAARSPASAAGRHSQSGEIAQSLVLVMLLPLGVGLILKTRYEELAARIKPLLDWLSNISLIS